MRSESAVYSNPYATTDSVISKCGSILVLQLKRYENFQGSVFKDTKHVVCLPSPDNVLEIPLDPNISVSFSNRYKLLATINHSGNSNTGHYWAFIKKKNTWFQCNDSSILKVKPSALNNSSSYLLFYVRV